MFKRNLKCLIVCIGIIAITVSSGLAAIVLDQTGGGSAGNYDGACWSLSDAGFSSSGDSFTQPVELESVSFRHGSGTGGTSGNLYLKIFDGNISGNGKFVGISTNTVNFAALTQGQTGTWHFAEVIINNNTPYSYVVGTGYSSVNPSSTLRFDISTSNPLSSGGVFASDTLYTHDPAIHLEAEQVNTNQTILDQPEFGNYANLSGGFWKLSESGFLAYGVSLTDPSYLKSVTFTRHNDGNGGYTTGDLYLKVFNGNTGGLGTYVGCSYNTINFGSLSNGEVGTWHFNNIVLSNDVIYSYVFGPNHNSGNPDSILRARTSQSTDPLPNGDVLTGDTAWGISRDPVVRVVTLPTPNVVLQQPSDNSYGNYSGAFCKLSDAGLDHYGSALMHKLGLQSVAFTRHGGGSGYTTGNLYLKIFKGNTGGLGTFVGVSTNTVNFGALGNYETGIWRFSNLELLDDVPYSFVPGVNNDSSNPSANIRIKSVSTNPLANGDLLTGDMAVGAGYDAVLRFEVTPIPPHGTLIILK